MRNFASPALKAPPAHFWADAPFQLDTSTYRAPDLTPNFVADNPSLPDGDTTPCAVELDEKPNTLYPNAF